MPATFSPGRAAAAPPDTVSRGRSSAPAPCYAWEQRYAEQERRPEGRTAHRRLTAALYAQYDEHVALGARYLRCHGYFADARSQAEDLVQGAVMQTVEFAYRHPECELRAVFNCILRRHAIDTIRRQERATSLDAGWADADRGPLDRVADPDSGSAFEAVHDRAADATRADALVDLLTCGQRQTVLALSECDGNLAAAAAELNTSYQAVTSRLALIRSKLRRQAPELFAGYSARERARR